MCPPSLPISLPPSLHPTLPDLFLILSLPFYRPPLDIEMKLETGKVAIPKSRIHL